MPKNAKRLLVQHSPHKQTIKCCSGYSWAVWMNVHPHQYDARTYFSLKYRLQTDSVRPFAKYTPHKRMKANAVLLHVHIMCFHVCFAFAYRFGCGLRHFDRACTQLRMLTLSQVKTVFVKAVIGTSRKWLLLRPWSSWTANSDKKLNVNKPCVTSQKPAFRKFCNIFCQFLRCHKFW